MVIYVALEHAFDYNMPISPLNQGISPVNGRQDAGNSRKEREMYDVTHEELAAAVEAEEREWLSTDDIHPYKSRVPQTKGNTVSFPKITKFNTYLLHHYGAEIVEEINELLYDGELAISRLQRAFCETLLLTHPSLQ